MKCPMTFNDPCCDAEHDCIGRECAWWIMHRKNAGSSTPTTVGCAVPFIAAAGLQDETGINRGSKGEGQ